MNSSVEGAVAQRPGSDPKHKRKRFRGNKGRGRNGSKKAAFRELQPDASSDGDQSRHERRDVERAGSGLKSGKSNAVGGVATSKPARNRGSYPLYAALDLGTNNCRLLIATPQTRGRFRVVDGYSRIVRLGEGLGQTGRLDDNAMDRAITALKVCAAKLKDRDVRRQRLIATEACRQALNGQLFLDRVKDETGLELEIVSREMEAHLAAEGCGALMDRKSGGAVLFDIGGGSSELILVDKSDRNNRKLRDQIVGWTSLPMGVVTLAERFGGRDVSRSSFEQMVACVKEEIEQFEERGRLDSIFNKGDAHLLGTSGTVTTLAGIHLRLQKYDRRKVDGLWLVDQEVDAIIDELLDMEYEQRASNPCIGKERADLVLAGCAILNAIRDTWPAERLRVADRGLREGLLTQMMYQDGAWRRPKKNRWSKKRRRRRSNEARSAVSS